MKSPISEPNLMFESILAVKIQAVQLHDKGKVTRKEKTWWLRIYFN